MYILPYNSSIYGKSCYERAPVSWQMAERQRRIVAKANARLSAAKLAYWPGHPLITSLFRARQHEIHVLRKIEALARLDGDPRKAYHDTETGEQPDPFIAGNEMLVYRQEVEAA